ncbi:Os10g0579900 [Oryza sativa Japonica Group]|uniref:Os10g0579900 protein n=1 Tax=Oryza sativa subsp. japonica TaxID=39947 RepID=A0A0P0XY31_ORYSJ|nr:hypothetical protein EE612_053010 [Oryza sativa]BAT12245.1 Os10g0579900 [Oryza sativa Japonica Group]
MGSRHWTRSRVRFNVRGSCHRRGPTDLPIQYRRKHRTNRGIHPTA